VPEVPEGIRAKIIQDYYRGYANPRTNPILANAVPADPTTQQRDMEKHQDTTVPAKETAHSSDSSHTTSHENEVNQSSPPLIQLESFKERCFKDSFRSVKGMHGRTKYYFFHGVKRDLVAEQTGINDKPKGFAASFLAKDLKKMHAHVEHYDSKTEHLYCFLQVMTAATVSFAHGANDVSNAIGPLSAIYLIWSSGKTSSKSPVPIWVSQC
jgi:sodium-dependent phosphate transporter